jgi:hypothetical protein
MEVSVQLHAPANLPLGKDPGTHWIGGWVGTIAGPNAVSTEKSLASASNQTPAIQPVACHYTGWAILAPVVRNINTVKPQFKVSLQDKFFVPVVEFWKTA